MPAARQNNCAYRIRFDSAQKSFCHFGRGYFNNLLGDLAMRLEMDTIRRLRIWRLAKTENFPGTLVKPIFVIIDAVFILRFDV